MLWQRPELIILFQKYLVQIFCILTADLPTIIDMKKTVPLFEVGQKSSDVTGKNFLKKAFLIHLFRKPKC